MHQALEMVFAAHGQCSLCSVTLATKGSCCARSARIWLMCCFSSSFFLRSVSWCSCSVSWLYSNQTTVTEDSVGKHLGNSGRYLDKNIYEYQSTHIRSAPFARFFFYTFVLHPCFVKHKQMLSEVKLITIMYSEV